MTWRYEWQNAFYDTQRWDYVYTNGHSFTRKGQVHRELQARQIPDDVLYKYRAYAYTMMKMQIFNTKAEAEAWVVACERME